MAEKIRQFNSQEKNLPKHQVSGEKLSHLNKLRTKEAKEAAEKHEGEKLKAREAIEKVVEEAEEAPRHSKKAEKQTNSVNIGFKNQQYKSTMRRIEAKLPTYQRAFSKVIHNRAVDVVANVTSKTIARPSGLLGSAIAASVGLIILYLNARKIGFEYPSWSAFIFFITMGWLAGILVEYVYGALKKILE